MDRSGIKDAINDGVKNLRSRVEGLSASANLVANSIEKFVEDKVGDRISPEQSIKKLTQAIESFVREITYQQQGLKVIPLKVVKMEHFKGELPKYESQWASGLDVRAQLTDQVVLKPGERFLVPTGLKFEIPVGYEMQVRPRSGWAIREGISLVNTPGTVDADYRGEVCVILVNHGQQEVVIKDQDRIAQLVLCPVVQAELLTVTDLGETSRGEGGFGSTGKSSSYQ
jgi:dUTP pyrophosphatase